MWLFHTHESGVVETNILWTCKNSTINTGFSKLHMGVLSCKPTTQSGNDLCVCVCTLYNSVIMMPSV